MHVCTRIHACVLLCGVYEKESERGGLCVRVYTHVCCDFSFLGLRLINTPVCSCVFVCVCVCICECVCAYV